MKKGILTFVMFLIITVFVSAQDYKTGLGLRAGFSSGLTIKHFTSRTTALEGLFTTRWQGYDFTGLYEVQHQAFDVEHLSWYYGGGAHIGFYDGDHATWGNNGTAYTIVGLDGILGMEYTFSEVPINIGIDWKPALNLFGYAGFWSEGALSIRYVF
jgi:hypothetical protein